jgi:hypothetical protein
MFGSGRRCVTVERFFGSDGVVLTVHSAATIRPPERPDDAQRDLRALLDTAFPHGMAGDASVGSIITEVWAALERTTPSPARRELGAEPLRARHAEIRQSLTSAVALGVLTIERVKPSVPAAPLPRVEPAAPRPTRVEPALPVTAWLGLKVVDQDDEPVAVGPVHVHDSDHRNHRFDIGASGTSVLKEVATGSCRVVLAGIDHRDVMSPAAAPHRELALKSFEYTTEQGDTVASIAHRYGFRDARTVWEDAKNEHLRDVRESPYVVLPGDVVVVSERVPPAFELAPSREHTVRVRVTKLKLRTRLLDLFGEPRANLDVEAEYAGRTVRTKTDAAGELALTVPASTRTVTLHVEDETLTMFVGFLDPAKSPSGAAGRLRNLGLLPDGLALPSAERLRFALELFLDRAGLDPAAVDADTLRSQLTKEHGV